MIQEHDIVNKMYHLILRQIERYIPSGNNIVILPLGGEDVFSIEYYLILKRMNEKDTLSELRCSINFLSENT